MPEIRPLLAAVSIISGKFPPGSWSTRFFQAGCLLPAHSGEFGSEMTDHCQGMGPGSSTKVGIGLLQDGDEPQISGSTAAWTRVMSSGSMN